MVAADNVRAFDRLNTSIRQFDVSKRTVLMPDMGPVSIRLLASAFRATGINIEVMDTCKGIELGREYTSGKECFPCQITLGDVLHHLNKEKERLGSSFNPGQYVYFLPEADGPCRFGMYNKMQRLVLDRFPEYKEIPIVYLSTHNGYATSDIMPPERSPGFRKLSYVAVIMADVLDRITWRVRPYENSPGATDTLMSDGLRALQHDIENYGASLDFNRLYRRLRDISRDAAALIDRSIPRRPRIGIVGEIYLRSHPGSNQNIIRRIEQFGGEVVNSSMGEWLNYVVSDRSRGLNRKLETAWRQKDHSGLRRNARALIGNVCESLYQKWRLGQVYRTATAHLDIQPDHTIGTIVRRLDGDRLFSFAIGTEAALSIGGAMEYVHHGFDGIVNVYPFTCMPSTICSAVLKPILHERGIPYLDAPYDGGIQPNRDVALRTFIYQAKQHFESLNGTNGKV